MSILLLCPEIKEKACISAGILKLMARFELATSSLPNGSGILILDPKIEQKHSKIDKKRQFRAEFFGEFERCKIYARWRKIYKLITQCGEM